MRDIRLSNAIPDHLSMSLLPVLASDFQKTTMSDRDTLAKLQSKEWSNCKKCGWFYKVAVLLNCPMCRHKTGQPVGYEQPAYEPPSIGT